MRGQYVMLMTLGLHLAVGCDKPQKTEPREVPAALESHVLDSLPSEIENRTFIDFEGKVHLLGYEIEPQRGVGPGGQVKLTMYWKSVAPLSPGWSLFTHLVDQLGKQVENKVGGDGGFDNIGPLRNRATPDGPQAFSPSEWTPGKVYVDVQDLRIPPTVKSGELTVLVGIWKPFEPAGAGLQAGGEDAAVVEPQPRSMRLRILAGPSDGNNRGLVTHLKTSWKPDREEPRQLHRAEPLKGRPNLPLQPQQARPPARPGAGRP